MNARELAILAKIKRYAQQAMEFLGDQDFSAFSCDAKTISAVVFSLGQIGELAGRLDDGFTKKYDSIPWRKIRGLRNRIVHDYEGIQLTIVWDVLKDFLPELITNIDKIT